MGTSTPFRGGKNSNPLLPDWLPIDAYVPLPDPLQNIEPDLTNLPNQPDGSLLSTIGSQPSQQSEPGQLRYQSARRNFTAYAKSGASNKRALGRATRAFVRRAGGGVGNSVKRMASERAAAVRLTGLLNRASTSPEGIREVARELNLGTLADGPVEDIYAALVDVVCPPDGDLDDSYAREAYLEAINEIISTEGTDLERPSAETGKEIIGAFIANAVHLRIENAIACNIITLPSDVEMVKEIESGLKDFVRGCVNDALNEAGNVIRSVDLVASVNGIFERAIIILDAKADGAAEGIDE